MNICPVCNSTEVSIFFEISQVPTHCNLIFSTRDDALKVTKGNIQLGLCKRCDHIFNYAFNPGIMKYDGNYENSLHCSPRFQEYAENLARKLLNRYNLYNKAIIDIGCGKGDFLNMLCHLGENCGIGFDPNCDPDRTITTNNGQITFIKDFYSSRYSTLKADCVCCRHVLEHIDVPQQFLKSIRDSIGESSKTLFFFEVPNGEITFRDLGIWDLIYEHCSYFSTTSLNYLFTSCGFDIFQITDTFDNQFLTIEAQPMEISLTSGHYNFNQSPKMTEAITSFTKYFERKVDTWELKLETLWRLGKHVVVWGAGSKGVSFLNILQVKDYIKYIVDINPYKHEKYVAGTGQLIISPNTLKKYCPDVILVMNSIYLSEIKQTVYDLGLKAEFVTV